MRPELQRRRLRLIHSGRLLTDGTFIYSWLTSLEDKQRKAVKEVTTEEDTPSPSQALTWLHCSVGPELTQEEEEENLTQVILPASTTWSLLIISDFVGNAN